jgi:cytochrome c-type biogenesis protein
MNDVSPIAAILGGLLSFLSPCVLPVLPVYIASMVGPEVFNDNSSKHRLTIFLHSLAFVAGFSAIFIFLGTSLGLFGLSIGEHLLLVRRIAGSLMIFFGIFMLAAPKISWLNYEKRLKVNPGISSSYLRSLAIGMLFAIAWTPCVGPLLGSILTLAFSSGSAWQGAYLLSLYSLGMGIPFLILGLIFNSIFPILKRISRYSSYVYFFCGLILIAVGILVIINKLNWFSL